MNYSINSHLLYLRINSSSLFYPILQTSQVSLILGITNFFYLSPLIIFCLQVSVIKDEFKHKIFRCTRSLQCSGSNTCRLSDTIRCRWPKRCSCSGRDQVEGWWWVLEGMLCCSVLLLHVGRLFLIINILRGVAYSLFCVISLHKHTAFDFLCYWLVCEEGIISIYWTVILIEPRDMNFFFKF